VTHKNESTRARGTVKKKRGRLLDGFRKGVKKILGGDVKRRRIGGNLCATKISREKKPPT